MRITSIYPQENSYKINDECTIIEIETLDGKLIAIRENRNGINIDWGDSDD